MSNQQDEYINVHLSFDGIDFYPISIPRLDYTRLKQAFEDGAIYKRNIPHRGGLELIDMSKVKRITIL